MEAHDADDDELDGFKDFTVSSSWERLIASVESVCREWLTAGRKQLLAGGAEAVEGLHNLHHVQAEVSQGFKKYQLTLYFSGDHDADEQPSYEWQPDLHHLQLWFGMKDFMVLSPVTFSGVLLDIPEATLLMSTVSIALSNCGSIWPVFVPVHVPARKAYLGIESSTTSSSVKFEADRLGTQVPVKLMHLEGLYELFVSKLGRTSEDSCRFGFTMRLTYATTGFPILSNHNSPVAEQEDELDADAAEGFIWDEVFPWAEWHSVEDPVNGFELSTVWRNIYVSSPLELAEFENASTLEADTWTLKPLLTRAVEEKSGFAGRLRRLVNAFVLSKEAEYVEDFVNVVKPDIEAATLSMKVPPSSVLDRLLKDLFFQEPQASKDATSYSRMIKGAPSESLFGRFCCHALWFGDCNIRAISMLWNEFIREVRWCWEELQHLPRHSPVDAPDFSTCLIQQKLQLLAACIDRSISRKSMDVDLQNWIDDAPASTSAKDTVQAPKKYKKEKRWASRDSGIELMETDNERRGSAGQFSNTLLSRQQSPLHAPLTQPPPIMTEDMLQEREQALAALDTSPSGNAARIRLQSDMLTSDMAAFKAANPGALLEDFVKWHSPRDWIEDNADDTLRHAKGKSLSVGGRLSKRMSQPGNVWEQLWENVLAVPASEQKLLFDYKREGEKVIHYLDTLRPHQLLAQMLCTAFFCAADRLSKTPGCSLEPIVSQFDELYAIMAVVLEPLGNVSISDEQASMHMEEWQRDLMQLCATFGKLEEDVALCASLKQKLPHTSPGLLTAVLKSKGNYATVTSFSDRDVVADSLFSHQNVSQRWEESLRMGNFLNGHEPLQREIVFTHYGGQVDRYGETATTRTSKTAARNRSYSDRMYICGTADDLQVAITSGSQD